MSLFISLIVPPPRSTLFPYTTLFRSCRHPGERRRSARAELPPSRARRVARARWAAPGHLAFGIAIRRPPVVPPESRPRSEEHTSELQSRGHLVCRLLLEKKNDSTLRT